MATATTTKARKATTKKTTAKKATAKKATAKKAAPRKATAKKAPARKVAAQRAASPVDTVREAMTSVAHDAEETVEQFGKVANDQFSEILDVARDIVDTSVGIPFVLQTRLPELRALEVDSFKSMLEDFKSRLNSTPSVDLDAVKAFLDEAKDEGHSRLAALQDRIEPVVENVGKRFEQAADNFEAQMPSQLGELIENGRHRLRTLIPA